MFGGKATVFRSRQDVTDNRAYVTVVFEPPMRGMTEGHGAVGCCIGDIRQAIELKYRIIIVEQLQQDLGRYPLHSDDRKAIRQALGI